MKHGALQSAEKYMKAHKRKKSWYRVVTGLACVVVFCTVYALILPAITMEKGACEIPEHTHSEACYTQVTSATRTEPVCTIESLNLHQHDDTCYDSEGNLTCGYADFVVHQHDSACYDENGNRWCPLPEIETHEHTRSCYAVPETDAPEAHTHTDDCYTVERGELICTESTEPAHVHTDGCYTETSALVCEEDHEHTESCYATTRELTCGDTEEPVHQHTDQCYEQIKTLICELPTEPAEEAEPAEPELICGEKEIILHTHEPYESPEDPGCYDDDGNLICGKIQVLEHQHTDACFETVEEPADTEALTCTLPEDEKHTHTALCYGTWELTCDMEEHTHTEECSTAEETEATEETEETTEPEEEMSGMEIDPSLPVMGTAYASGAKTRAYSVMTLDADTTGATNPVSVENYITGATLYYRTNENGEWTDVSGAKDIPGDADFKLVISYGNVPIDDLLAAGGKMAYTLPGLLRNATANGSITSGTYTEEPTVAPGYKAVKNDDNTWRVERTSSGGYYYYGPSITAVLNGTNKSATDYPGGDYGLVFRSTAAFSTFQGVQVDGKTLAKSNYTAEEGSTVVYLKAAYLKTLAAGKHTITILSTAGNTSMDFTIGGKSSSPKTFDAGVGIYAVTAVLSVTGMAWTAKKRH